MWDFCLREAKQVPVDSCLRNVASYFAIKYVLVIEYQFSFSCKLSRVNFGRFT